MLFKILIGELLKCIRLSIMYMRQNAPLLDPPSLQRNINWTIIFKPENSDSAEQKFTVFLYIYYKVFICSEQW